MCGIFSYYGAKENAPEIVIEGLKCLEYRGYDSWGIAYKKGSEISIIKKVGKISDFNESIGSNLKSNIALGETLEQKATPYIAIGHSRWATHGGVTEANAHPHTSENNEVVIVHNGIVENYLEIKNELLKVGIKFKSETDTEVIAHLISQNLQNNSFEESVRLATKKMHGRYAFIAILKNSEKMIAARKGSPLIIGVNYEKKEYFIASDIPAFIQYTNKVVYLDDQQMAVISQEGINFFDLELNMPTVKRVIEIDLDIETSEKGEYPHFMIKEIMEQKDTLSRAINQDPKTIEKIAKEIQEAFGTYLIGCGTAGKVCMVGEYLFSTIAKKHVNFCFSSEFSWHKHFLTDKTLLLSVSQSGETADSLEAIETAKNMGVRVASIVNVESSTMARISDNVIPIKAGPEKAVASTKATTSQLAILTMLAYATGGRIDEGKKLLIQTASQINDMLNPRYEENIMELAKKIQSTESMYIIGRGINYPIALEAAIKLQEVSYIHAEGFAGGELKHGPIALISKGTPVISLVANDESKNDILSNTMEVKARGAYVIGISPENYEVFDYWIKAPDAGNASPIVNIIPIQILSYHLALLRQNDPDKPRNLAKSVTVK